MKKVIILILLCQVWLNCSVNRGFINNEVKESIISLYIDIHELEAKEKDFYLKNFSNYVTLEKLLNNSSFNQGKGVFFVKINSSHCTKHLLLLGDNTFKIVNLDYDLRRRKNDVYDFMQLNNLFNDITFEEYESLINNQITENQKLLKHLSPFK